MEKTDVGTDMRAPCEEEGGIIAQPLDDVNDEKCIGMACGRQGKLMVHGRGRDWFLSPFPSPAEGTTLANYGSSSMNRLHG